MNAGCKFQGSKFFVTGGTGTFGKAFARDVLTRGAEVVVYSRDEYKQYMMKKEFDDKNIRFVIGDVRDAGRLASAMKGCDYVVHAAALKHVAVLEEHPFEGVQTNIVGTKNVIDAAKANNVKRAVLISSDKAVRPVNLYGASKMAAEKLFRSAGGDNCDTEFVTVRYGNVAGSRGSVVPFFMSIKNKGLHVYPITDFDMTRFWLRIEKAVQLVRLALDVLLADGCVFVPKLPTVTVTDIAKAIDPLARFEIIGVQPGEKLHEDMVAAEDVDNTWVVDLDSELSPKMIAVRDSFSYQCGYCSKGQPRLKVEEIAGMIEKMQHEHAAV